MLFWKLISVSIRSQMQYSASFITLCLAHFLSTSVYILAIGVLFDRFHIVKGWTFYEVGLIYGIVHIGFGLAESFARGFERFSQMLIQGDFDRVLLERFDDLSLISYGFTYHRDNNYDYDDLNWFLLGKRCCC